VTGAATTRFSAVSLAEDTIALGERLASLLGTADITPARFEAEREAVLVETRASDDSPLTRLGPRVAEAACPGHGLGSTLVADVAGIARITPEDVARTARLGYRRDRAHLAIAGPDLPVDGLLEAIDRAAAVTVRDCAETAVAKQHGSPLPLRIPGQEGLVAVSWVRFDDGNDLDGALMGKGGHLETAVSALGHAVLGRATVEGIGVRVDILCWRAGDAAADLAQTLVTVRDRLLSDAAAPHALRRAALTRLQNDAYQSATPLGAATRLLEQAGQPPVPGLAQNATAWARREVDRLGVWRLRDGVPCRET
jgi:hypothetical protein